MKQETELNTVTGSVFEAQRDKELRECHEILDNYSDSAIQMAAEEVAQR